MPEEQMFEELKESVINLDKERVEAATREALKLGLPPRDIIAKGLVKGMKEIGDAFGRRELFLPELLLSGAAMKAAFDLLQPQMRKEGVETEGKVVIGTVQGDIHDIGKNIVGALLEGNGFEVFDLGVDVPTEIFIEKINEIKPDVVALSALLSSTVSQMFDTVSILREKNIRAKIIIGGAATTQSVADEMKADAYGSDAWEGVQKIQQLVKMRGKNEA